MNREYQVNSVFQVIFLFVMAILRSELGLHLCSYSRDMCWTDSQDGTRNARIPGQEGQFLRTLIGHLMAANGLCGLGALG